MFLVLMLTCCLNAPTEVTVEGDLLTVGAVLPLPDSDPRAAVALGHAPNPGVTRRIQKHEIAGRIRTAGLDAEGLALPESILVRRKGQRLDIERVREAVLGAFIERFPEARIELTLVDAPPIETVGSAVNLRATLPERFTPSAPVYVRLEVRGNGNSRTVYVRTSVHIELVQPVVRLRVPANSEIRADHLEWVMSPLDGERPAPASFDAFRGMLAKRDLEPGLVLKTDFLYMPLYVQKGETVTVKATSGGVTIAATMRARASGRYGDTIMVEHLTGNGSTTARIVGPRVLEAR